MHKHGQQGQQTTFLSTMMPKNCIVSNNSCGNLQNLLAVNQEFGPVNDGEWQTNSQLRILKDDVKDASREKLNKNQVALDQNNHTGGKNNENYSSFASDNTEYNSQSDSELEIDSAVSEELQQRGVSGDLQVNTIFSKIHTL